MIKTWIAYGRQQESFHLPSSVSFSELTLPEIKPTKQANDAIRQALDKPIGMTSLAEVVRKKNTICIISDDISRPTPVGLILDTLLPELHQLGFRPEDIFIMMALGSHRRMTDDELIAKLGIDVVSSYRIIQSGFNDDEAFVSIGYTSQGDDIWLAKEAMSADIRIGIGNIVPHNTLGFSGGGKILFPGIAHEKSVSDFHRRAAQYAGGVFGKIENPVRDEVEVWVEKAGLHFIINTILNRQGEIIDCVAGHYKLAHRAGVKLAYNVYAVPFIDQADIVIVDGEPSSFDFWQGTKGLNAASIVVKKGGSVILSCPCDEGIGPHLDYLHHLGGKHHLDEDGDALAVSVGKMMFQLKQYYDTYMLSNGVSEEEMMLANIEKINSIEDCIPRLLEKYGAGCRVTIIRDGAEILPYPVTA